jgi:hypothetical protein
MLNSICFEVESDEPQGFLLAYRLALLSSLFKLLAAAHESETGR